MVLSGIACRNQFNISAIFSWGVILIMPAVLKIQGKRILPSDEVGLVKYKR